MSEYWAVQPVLLEIGCPIRLGQLTHSGPPLSIPYILRIVFVRTTRLEWESMVTYQSAQPWWYVLIVVIRID
jgi:hypothetical protein